MSNYQSGFGNEFATEALQGALPVGRNSPQRCPYGLYAEQLSGTAFTALRADNRRSWLYRIRPSAMHTPFKRIESARIVTDFGAAATPPNQLRWNPLPAPTSAALANLCAFRLDLRLDGLAHALGARYTRYADDIVLSGERHLSEVMPRIEAWVGRIALEEGFSLNHRKMRCLTAGRRQSVCSIVVNQRPNLPRPEFDRLKAILHQCVVQGPAAQNREGKPHWREYLHGRVAWAAQLNPGKTQRLKRLLDQIDWSR